MITPKHEAIEMAKDVLYTIIECTENGLPSVYDDIKDWLVDLWAALPWDEGAIHSLEWLVSDSEATAAIQQFNEALGFNLTKELLEALIDYQTKVQINTTMQRSAN